MERLNCLRCQYRHEDNGNCTACGGFCTAVPAAHCRLLQEYLDTGLTPKEVPTAVEMAQIYSIIEENKRYRALNVTVERLKELARADREGRVVVLPCKVGDKLYRVFDGNISEHEVQNMKYFARRGRLGIDMTPFFPDAERFIGKTVFLTREEAEEALEG